MSTLTEFIDDPDFFDIAKAEIEKDLSNLKKVIDSINQMRVQAAYLESDLITLIDCNTWKNISELIGLTNNLIDVTIKKE